MSKYSDPENVRDLIASFLTLENTDEIKDFIDANLTEWLVASTDSYTEDYPQLQQNWELICRMNSVQPQKVVIVDEIFFDDDHIMLRTIAETMTRKGYVVRRKEELTGCEDCRKALPTKPVWRQMKNRGLPVPRTWKPVCSRCELRRI